MRTFNTNSMGAAALFVVAALNGGCSRAVADVRAGGRPASDLDLTVYKDDFAMVHDVRSVDVTTGTGELRLPGVSKQLDPNSVLFDWPGQTSHPEVVSTTYNMGVSSSQDLLKRIVGQRVDVVWRGQDGKVGDQTSGILEEAGQGTVLHTKDSYLIDPGGEIVAPSTESIPTMPELAANVQSSDAGSHKLGLSYLTRGLSWSADYVGTIDSDGKNMRLECWGTITNNTGTDFPMAKLKLVAGSPNRAAVAGNGRVNLTYTPASSFQARDMSGYAVSVPNLPPRAVGDLYTYDIPAPATIAEGQMNRARIATVEKVPIVRSYSIDFSNYTGTDRHTAQVSIAFSNNKGSGLGFPLPAGTLRAYESDQGEQSYVGAADIADTPKDERVSATLSNAFDVYGKITMLDLKRVGKHKQQRSYRIEVHNDRKTATDVRVVDPMEGAIQVLQESDPSKKANASTVQWTVSAPAGGVKTITFTVVMTV